MTEKELKKLNRRELLEMLLAQTKRAERLQEQLDEAKARLDEKESAITDAGTLSDAVLKLSGVFDAAEKAANEYISQGKQYMADAKAERDRIIKDANAEAEKIKANAEAKVFWGPLGKAEQE